ncbi:PadR family transcriptional regulator [Nostocoides sp. Soil756]|uniref:PadR family transcriptional regulator n=1 Tax=Nostocoides sp. Soil756 TaxID=1736399 RepID=UPI00138F0B15
MAVRTLDQLRRGVLRASALVLIDGRPRYGLELAAELRSLGGKSLSTGTIYPLLHRLRDEGMLTVVAVPSPLGPPRNQYFITARGQDEVAEFRAIWPDFSNAVERMLAQTREPT